MTTTANSDPLPALEHHLALLIGSLSTKQREELKLFTNSALFCDDPAVRRLIIYIDDHWARRPAGGFLPQVLYLEVYQRKIVEPEKMAVLFSRAIAVTEEYMAVTALRSDPMKKSEYLTKHVAELPETTVFRAALSAWQQAVAEAPESYEKLYQKGRVLQEEWSHWATDRYKKAPRLINGIINAQEEYNQTVERLFELAGVMRANLIIDDAIGAKPVPESNILLALTDQLIALHREPADETAYQVFLATYMRSFKRLGNVEGEFMLRSVVNYCVKQIQAGHSVFIQYLFKICNWATRQKTFTARWLRSDADFLNIALAFCRPDALLEMHDFIQQHAKNLPVEIREQVQALALAYYYFFKGELPVSLSHLDKVVSREILYKLRFHSLRIRIYYEIGKPNDDFEGLERALVAYDKYFDRDEWLHDRRRDNYIRLAWFVRKMMAVERSRQPGAQAEAYNYLYQAIQDTTKATPIAREWIITEISKWRPDD